MAWICVRHCQQAAHSILKIGYLGHQDQQGRSQQERLYGGMLVFQIRPESFVCSGARVEWSWLSWNGKVL